MDIFLVGHGFMARNRPAVTIPDKLTVVFYCKEDKPFDSNWEASVINGVALSNQYTPKHGVEDFQITSIKGPANCLDHVLTRPGGIKLIKPFKDCKEIDTAVAEGVQFTASVDDKDTFCVKKKGNHDANYASGRSHTYLSDIVNALKAKVPNGVTVHWCACRSPMADWEEVDEQAASMPAVRG